MNQGLAKSRERTPRNNYIDEGFTEEYGKTSCTPLRVIARPKLRRQRRERCERHPDDDAVRNESVSPEQVSPKTVPST